MINAEGSYYFNLCCVCVCLMICSYFQRLASEFEIHMLLYRQQIAELENHLESADRAAAFTPQGIPCFRRMYFIVEDSYATKL